MLATQSLPAQSADTKITTAFSDTKPTTASFNTLPAELLLEIIPYIPFTSRNLSHLRLTNTKLHHLVQGHEHGLVKDIKRTQIPLTSLRLFPSLETETYSGLSTFHARLSTLDDLHSEWLRITSSGPDLDWLKGRWESVHKIGLLLLYRLQDTGSYPNKVALLNSLPTTSLACLLFKLIASIKILRIYGPCPINGHHAAGDILQRSDIELAFEEMLLQHGPDFFLAMLKAGDKTHPKSEWAIASLCTEISTMFHRQHTYPPKPPTLTSCLRRAFAARIGCHFSQNIGKMWEILSSTVFDDLNEEKICQVVEGGEELRGGMKRIF